MNKNIELYSNPDKVFKKAKKLFGDDFELYLCFVSFISSPLLFIFLFAAFFSFVLLESCLLGF